MFMGQLEQEKKWFKKIEESQDMPLEISSERDYVIALKLDPTERDHS